MLSSRAPRTQGQCTAIPAHRCPGSKGQPRPAPTSNPVTHGEEGKHGSFPCPGTRSHNGFSPRQPRQGCSPSSPCHHAGPKAPSCSGDSAPCQPSSWGRKGNNASRSRSASPGGLGMLGCFLSHSNFWFCWVPKIRSPPDLCSSFPKMGELLQPGVRDVAIPQNRNVGHHASRQP